MSAQPHHIWTEEEYLEFERASDTKHEYYRGEVYPREGCDHDHNVITMNAFVSLHSQLRKRPHLIFTSDMRLKVSPVIFYTYPDFSVVGDNPEFADKEQDNLLNPTLISEVMSPSTENYDRGDKFRLYRALESLQEYVLISQESYHIEHYLRQPDGTWLYSDAQGLEATLELPSIQCTLVLSDVYEKVTLEDAAPRSE